VSLWAAVGNVQRQPDKIARKLCGAFRRMIPRSIAIMRAAVEWIRSSWEHLDTGQPSVVTWPCQPLNEIDRRLFGALRLFNQIQEIAPGLAVIVDY
jgi:hypothetical protein